MRILHICIGVLLTLCTPQLVAKQGHKNIHIRPIPWLTTGAITCLEDFFATHDNPYVLEFGSGAKTLWMAQRTSNLFSVEHCKKWHAAISKKLASTLGDVEKRLILHSRPYDCVWSSFEPESFDLIIVDGRDRVRCIKAALLLLKKGGIMMLDNSERYWYIGGVDLMNSWEVTHDIQTVPDACGFYYKGWRTSWWIKPH